MLTTLLSDHSISVVSQILIELELAENESNWNLIEMSWIWFELDRI